MEPYKFCLEPSRTTWYRLHIWWPCNEHPAFFPLWLNRFFREKVMLWLTDRLFVYFVSETHRIGQMHDNTWLLGNINQTGYFRVNYDLQNWKLLIQQLHNNPQVNLFISLFVWLCLILFRSFTVLFFYWTSVCLSFFQIISVGNRAGLIDDAFNLAR